MSESATVRVGTLNVRHGGGSRRVALADAITGWAVDAVVLSEWSPNGDPSMRALLEARAWNVLEAVADLPSRHYGVAVASPHHLSRGLLCSAVDPSRLVHARVTVGSTKLDLLGTYVPSGSPDLERKNAFLAELTATSRCLSTDGPPLVLAGDLNGDHAHATGGRDRRLVGSDEFAALHGAGWRDPFVDAGLHRTSTWSSPKGDAPGFKLDHLWLRGRATAGGVAVLDELGGVPLHPRAANGDVQPLTDHAVLQAEITLAVGTP